jgi:hypothetical protein
VVRNLMSAMQRFGIVSLRWEWAQGSE